jgi:gamma-tubulin complex component 4
LKNQEDTFAAELHRLKQQPLFSLVDFEQVVDGICSTVAEVCILLTLFKEKSGLGLDFGFFFFWWDWGLN